MTRDDLKEQIADLVHRIWAGWWDYQDACSERTTTGSLVIPKNKVQRWDRQAKTDYNDLSEDERFSDIEIAEQYLELIDTYTRASNESAKAADYWEAKILQEATYGNGK